MQYGLLLRTLTLFLAVCCVLPLQNTEGKSKQNTESVRLERIRRAVYSRKPGFFRTLFSVIYEQYADTKNTFNNISSMVNDNFLPENQPLTTTTPNPDPNATTTEAPYKITRTEFNKIILRNLRGLVRLYNIELKDALKQSEKTRAEFRKNASIEVSKFL